MEKKTTTTTTKTHKSAQKLMLPAQILEESLPRPLSTYFRFQLSIFMGFLTVGLSGALTLMPTLDTLLFFLTCVQLQYDFFCFIL